MQKFNTKERGISLIGLILLALLIIIILGYFNVRLRDVAENPNVKDNLEYVEEGSTGFWNQYLKRPATYLWQDIWIELFWRPFVDNMKRIKDKLPTDYDLNAPTVNVNNSP